MQTERASHGNAALAACKAHLERFYIPFWHVPGCATIWQFCPSTCTTSAPPRGIVATGFSPALDVHPITLVGFGTFKVVKRKARTGVNPQTKEKLKIPARKAVKFVAGKTLKESV